MPDLDTNPIMHHLSIAPGVKPMKQKLRKMHPCIALLVKEKLESFLKATFIQTINYGEWILNIVSTLKEDKSIQACPYFRDLNKACPKDYFLLLNIDMTVDLTARF